MHLRVRYAKNNGRFKACSLLNEIDISTDTATEFPQNSGSLNSLLQHGRLPQNEDSFFLDIWAPENKDIKPVLFWIHGGAFCDGSSADKNNDASNLAQNTNCIVVSVSYRLGILGTLSFDDNHQKNCGFHDIITALQWTNLNINKFNGDKNNITIGGQSSGAWYVMALLTCTKVSHLFQKAILFSYPGTMKAITENISNKISQKVFSKIKHRNINSVPIQDLLNIQKQIGKENKRKYRFTVPFLPSVEEHYISDNFICKLKNIKKKIFVQFTANESAAYIYNKPLYANFPLILLPPLLKKYNIQNALNKLRTDKKLTKDSYITTVNVTSDILFKNPAKEISDLLPEQTEIHPFTFSSGNERLLCCHCLDLPFLFGNFDIWEKSYLLSKCNIDKAREESKDLQEKIKAFIQ